jgi:hypothetical protein
MLWLLTGLALGFEIVQDERQKRMYLLRTRTKEQYVHATAVNALVGKKFVTLTEDRNKFRLTPEGFGAAHDRLKQTGLSPKTSNKKPNEHLACAYSSDGLDSSLYVG